MIGKETYTTEAMRVFQIVLLVQEDYMELR